MSPTSYNSLLAVLISSVGGPGYRSPWVVVIEVSETVDEGDDLVSDEVLGWRVECVQVGCEGEAVGVEVEG